MQIQLADGKGPHCKNEAQLVLLLGHELCVV
jgi:hypothetical protein